MNQPARKPGDAGGKIGDALSVDDPSIPVLTERLTLPPLDLNLDFRLPERPAAVETPAEDFDDLLEPAAEQPLPQNEPAPPVTELPPAPVTEMPAAVEPSFEESVEPTDVAPRVPTSLLVSNIDALLATPPASTARDPDEFDLTQSDGRRSNGMETELREMILLDIARRLPTEVEAIVRRHLDNAIEEAIRRFAAEVRIALAGSLREIVDRAVKAELDRLNSPRS
jgi:hypothetical protein